jgi:hypothetical protein
MIDPEHRQRAVGRLLEDESLTADLPDAAAQCVLDWALRQLDAVLADDISPEDLDAFFLNLRRAIKRIGQQGALADLEGLENLADVLQSQPEQSEPPLNRDDGARPSEKEQANDES